MINRLAHQGLLVLLLISYLLTLAPGPKIFLFLQNIVFVFLLSVEKMNVEKRKQSFSGACV